jgi:hypothetical protein
VGGGSVAASLGRISSGRCAIGVRAACSGFVGVVSVLATEVCTEPESSEHPDPAFGQRVYAECT